jgi:hypothetical protein
MIRILLDTKDLIELVERSYPISPARLSEWLKAHDASMVLTSTNVSEFARGFENTSDRLHARSMFQTLDALPVTYIREPVIEVSEIELAIEAFNSANEPRAHSPYVRRWDDTFAVRGEAAPGAMIVGYRLDMMVFDMWKARGPETTAHQQRLSHLAKQTIIDERAIPPDRRLKPREALTRALEQKIAYWKLPSPRDIVAFGKWVYADATRCPGFRIAWEAFRLMVANVTDSPEDNDVWDNAHFPAVPYVDYVTFDRRMNGYFLAACTRIANRTPAADYRKRLCRNLPELFAD